VRVAVNSLSVAAQAQSVDEIEACFAEIVECFRTLLPALEVKTAELLVDASLEERSIAPGQAFLASINHVRDRQTRIQWFIYVKNRARLLSNHIVSVLAGVQGEKVQGRIPEEFVLGSTHWLSFRGALHFPNGIIEVSIEESATMYSKPNAANRETCEQWLPQYEASPKHKQYPYEMNGEIVSQMDLTSAEALMVLRRSILVGDRRYGVLGQQYYEFKLTRVDGLAHIYHGYQVSIGDLPSPARDFLAAAVRID
jgi:hypothetical protein